MDDIYELMHRVREHPDFVFGTIFTTDDFDGEVPERFPVRHAEDVLAERGNDFIWDWNSER